MKEKKQSHAKPTFKGRSVKTETCRNVMPGLDAITQDMIIGYSGGM